MNTNKNKNEEYKNKKYSIEYKEEVRKNKHLIIKDIKEQKEQNRNRSKKAKKLIEKKNKSNKTINSPNITSNINNSKINTIKTNNNGGKINNPKNINENEVEKYLKNKATVSIGNKNFLSSSINYSLINEFEFPKSNLKAKTDIKNNDIINNKLQNNIITENIKKEKEDYNKQINILIPMTNMTKENNCFLNVLIQVLFHLESFKKFILDYYNDNYLIIKDEVVSEFCNIIKSYHLEQIKNKNTETSIEPILSVNNLRKKLNFKYGNYFKGECGDPMESLEHIFNSIHEEFNTKSENLSSKKKENLGVGDCPIHHFFYLDLIEKSICSKCGTFTKKHYDKNCYMFSIFISELSNRINQKNLDFENMHLNLFYQIKEQNEKYDTSNARIERCKCPEINNIKKLNLLRVNNSYVIINLTWSDEFPDLKDILNVYTSLPLSDKNKHLFNVSEEKDQKILYIKSIILYGIYHYICVIYLNNIKKWGIIDDKTIKYIDKYYDLVDYLLKNHLSPVGLIYSYEQCDKIEELDMKMNLLSKEKYLQILKFCKEVDNKKNLKMSYINKSKDSLNEINDNYLDKNLFSNSFLNQLINSSSSSSNGEEKEVNKNSLKKSSLIKKSSEEENEKNSENDINIQKVDNLLKAKGKSIKNSILFLED